jgi:hypothetical protein
MNKNDNHDALARKRRFVESLTRTRTPFHNDEDLLKPTTHRVNEDTSNPIPPSSSQSTRFIDHRLNHSRSLLVFTHHLCERCTHAVAHLQEPNEYEFVLCTERVPAFPTNPPCTSFQLDTRME